MRHVDFDPEPVLVYPLDGVCDPNSLSDPFGIEGDY